MEYFKVYGLQRSGTNYLKALLEENFDVRVLQNIGGWKHDFVDENFYSCGYKSDFNTRQVQSLEQDLREGRIKLLHIYKNPYMWICSYIDYCIRMKRPVESIEKLMQDYNEKNIHWEGRCDLSIDYEDLLNDYQCRIILSMIQNFIKQKINRKKIITFIDNKTGRGDDSSYKKYLTKQKFNKDFYLNKEYMKEFTYIDIQKIEYLNKFYQW